MAEGIAERITVYWVKPALYGVVALLPFSIALSEIFILFTLLGVIAHVWVTHSFRQFVTPLLAAVAAYILASLLSALLCDINPKSVHEVSHLLLYVFLFASIYIARNGMFTKWHLYLLLVAVAVGALNGIVQYFNDTGFLGRRAPHHPGVPPRVRGTFSNSLTYTGFYGMALFFVLPLLEHAKKHWKIVTGLLLSSLSVVLVLSYARGAIVAALITSLVFVLRQRKYLIHFAIIISIAVIGSYFMLPGLTERIRYAFEDTTAYSTFKTRFQMWGAALDFFEESPVVGIGPGAFTAKYDMWKPSPVVDEAAHAHNQYLEVLSTTGIIGTTTFLIVLFLIFRKLLRGMGASGKLKPHPVTQGAFYALMFLCLASIFECHFSDEEIFNFFSLLTGLGIGFAVPERGGHDATYG